MTWRELWLFSALGVALGGCSNTASLGGSPSTPPSPEPERVVVTLQPTLTVAVPGAVTFHGDRAGRHRLFTLNLAGGDVTRLTTGREFHDEDAAWSPDGRLIAFTTTRFDARTWDIGVMDAGGASIRRVTTHLAFDRHAAWMPDGQSVVFSSERDGTQAVFRARLDSGEVTRVSPPPDRALCPTVSPDGGRVAYIMGTRDGLATGSAWNVVQAANLSRTLDWPQDRSTVEMLDEVARSTEAGGSPPERVRIGVDWMFYPVARYYVERRSTSQTRYEVIVLPGDGLPIDFAYTLTDSDRPKGTELRRFPASDAVLFKMS